MVLMENLPFFELKPGAVMISPGFIPLYAIICLGLRALATASFNTKALWHMPAPAFMRNIVFVSRYCALPKRVSIY